MRSLEPQPRALAGPHRHGWPCPQNPENRTDLRTDVTGKKVLCFHLLSLAGFLARVGTSPPGPPTLLIDAGRSRSPHVSTS